jgi:hypothetical protein
MPLGLNFQEKFLRSDGFGLNGPGPPDGSMEIEAFGDPPALLIPA